MRGLRPQKPVREERPGGLEAFVRSAGAFEAPVCSEPPLPSEMRIYDSVGTYIPRGRE